MWGCLGPLFQPQLTFSPFGPGGPPGSPWREDGVSQAPQPAPQQSPGGTSPAPTVTPTRSPTAQGSLPACQESRSLESPVSPEALAHQPAPRVPRGQGHPGRSGGVSAKAAAGCPHPLRPHLPSVPWVPPRRSLQAGPAGRGQCCDSIVHSTGGAGLVTGPPPQGASPGMPRYHPALLTSRPGRPGLPCSPPSPLSPFWPCRTERRHLYHLLCWHQKVLAPLPAPHKPGLSHQPRCPHGNAETHGLDSPSAHQHRPPRGAPVGEQHGNVGAHG